MKNTNKGFIVPLLIAIIAVLVIGGGVYYYSQNKPKQAEQQPITDNQIIPTSADQTKIPTANNISDWKTYTNAKYGYQIKYPAGAKITENPTDIDTTMDTKICVEISYMSGYVYINAPGYDVVCGGSTGLSPDYVKIKDSIKIGDKIYNAYGAYISTGKPNINGGYLSVIVDGGFIITFGVNSDQNDKIKNIIYQMLATFRPTI